jgi:hypothetical protein
MARKTEHHFEVAGTGRFPLDMLRYDGCWPRQSADARAIERSVRGEPDTVGAGGGRTRSISLTGIKAPTVDRWRSFGWEARPTR